MKYTLLFLSLQSTFLGYSQLNDTIWYDENWQEIEETDTAHYYRLYNAEDIIGPFKVEDHFVNGKLQMSDQFLDKEYDIKTGEFTWYFENGQKERQAVYKNGKNHGDYKEWYENGQLSEEETYKMDKEVGTSRFWYKDGILKSLYKWDINGTIDSVYFWWENGQIELVGTVLDYKSQYIRYDQYYGMSGEQLIADGQGYKMEQYKQHSIEGPIVDGYRSGDWTIRNNDGKITGEMKFSEGRFIKGYLLENGFKDKFTKWEREPEYAKGGVKGMTSYIREQIYYAKDKSDWIEGTIYLKFIVEKDGSITQVEISEGSGSSSQETEMIRIIREMPKWEPGVQAGAYVRIRYTVPIKYKHQK